MKYVTLLAVLALGGCSGQPSDSDLRSALERAVTEQLKSLPKPTGNPAFDRGMADAASRLKVEFVSVKKLSCKNDGDKAYLCDVETVQKDSPRKNVRAYRFIKDSDGWMITR
jgi:hypothetical protein